MATQTAPSLADILEARERLTGVARETPVYGSETLSRITGREVSLKAENLQRTGAFKVRGAFNRISTLTPQERAAGVVAASAGNHGQAVAWAARAAGISARIYVPQDAPMAKVEACRTYGSELIMEGAGFEEALTAAMAYVDETGATFIHPFEDPAVIAGQGTIGLELAEQVPEAETVVIPIGGGGLASGIALALRANRPDLRIVGVQAGLSGFTIADGLDDMVDVDDESISEAIVLLLERTKLVVEGAGAVGVAALLADKVGGSGPVAIVLSGGNIDPTLLISVMRHGLTLGGRYLVIRTQIPDRPGELVRLLSLIAEARGNVVSVEHHREGMDLSVAETEVELTLITRDQEHCAVLLDEMHSWGYTVERLK
jgi:threonine dehydratase